MGGCSEKSVYKSKTKSRYCKEHKIAFSCEGCGINVWRDSDEHDESKCDDTGEIWYCPDCDVKSDDEDNGDDECYECGASESVEQCSECDKIFCPCHGPHYHYLTEPDEIYCDSCVESLKKRRLLSVGQPEFLDLMWGVIDNSPRLQDAKYIIRMKYRELLPFTTDDVIDRSARLYHLSKKLKGHLKRRKDTNKLYFK